MFPLNPLTIAIVVVVVLVVLFSVTCIKIVPQAQAAIVERLGSYLTTWNNGLHVKIPFIDRVRAGITLKEQVADFPPQPVITKDNVTMSIDSVVFFKIMDPKLYAYGVENPLVAIENLAATTLRNIIGDLELDQTLTSRDVINTRMRAILDEAPAPWAAAPPKAAPGGQAPGRWRGVPPAGPAPRNRPAPGPCHAGAPKLTAG